jgi:signal transduction histidine kinase
MFSLIPEWAHHYGEFWKAIRIRNLWFIRLRYLAVVILLAVIYIGEFLLGFRLTSIQLYALTLISLSILFYNAFLHSIRKYVGCVPNKFNALHLSLIQMILDLVTLMLAVYYTGVIESPLHLFFVFHMIIGSMILPGIIVYLAAISVSITFGILSILQRYDIVERHFIHGLYSNVRPHTITYDIIFILGFGFTLIVSVYFANKISRQLYKREQQLRETLEKLNEAEITKQKYIMGVVHEVKTPVSAIHSIIDLIIKKFVGPITDEVESKLVRAKLRSEETLQLLNDILRISKLKLLDVRSTEEIDINSFLESMLDKLNESAKTKSIELKLYDNRTIKKKIRSDSVLLELAISNLLSNAIKYGNENGKVNVIIENINDNLKLDICDDGIGIPQDSLPKIFNQFYRASNIDKNVHEGTGMGLAIVKEIVEIFGGTIKVNSPSRIGNFNNPGTEFIIELPFIYKSSKYDIFEVNSDEYLKSGSSV